MIRWNGKRYVPAGVKPLMKGKGVKVPGMPKTKWIASWVGGQEEQVLDCDFTYEFILDPTPTQTLTSTATPTPTITSSSTPTPTPTATYTPTPTTSETVFDSDAAAYLADVIASGGTTNPTISAATNTLFTSLKSNGLYSKMIVMYPFVGGTASSHSINANLNKTYDITWNGGMTHDISGSTGNASNGYGNTNFTTQDYTSMQFSSFGLYINGGDINANGLHGGFFGGNDGLLLGANDGNQIGWRHGQFNGTSKTSNGGVLTGNFISIRTGITQSDLYKNSVNIDTLVVPPQSTYNIPFYLFAANVFNIFTDNYSNDRLSFAFLANNLTYSEVPILSTIINTFQTSLGRNTY